jgi:hypothetical protein
MPLVAVRVALSYLASSHLLTGLALVPTVRVRFYLPSPLLVPAAS